MNIYLDSSIVVAVLFNKHKFHAQVSDLFSSLRLKNQSIFVSLLAIDEVWYTLFKLSRSDNQSFAFFSSDFRERLQVFFSTEKIHLVSFRDSIEILNVAFNASIKYNLRPRDAFHYSYAKNLKANLYTLDQDFTKTNLPVTLLYKALSK